MKKKIAMILAVVMCFGMLMAGCGNSNKETEDKETTRETSAKEDESLQKVLDKGELVMGLDPAFPPMGFTDDNQDLVGFDIDVAKELCERMGIELVLTPIDWDTKEQELETEAIDCIWNGFTLSPARAEQLLCSEPYMDNTQVVVVLKDSDVQTLDDLAGKTITVQSTSTAEDAIDENTEFKESLGDVISVKDNVQAMLELGQNSSDAVVMDKVVAMYYMEQHKDEYRVLDEELSQEEYVIGFRKGDQALCDEIIKRLKDMAADGSLAEISNKWFGEDITKIKW